MILEICIDAFASAQTAKAAGADRIEVCSALNIGGITPSFGLLAQVAPNIDMAQTIMIRPRSGDFIYTSGELETMAREIEWVVSRGFKSIVLGILTPARRIDLERLGYLVGLAKGLEVVFHRAFDVADCPDQDIPGLIDLGIKRILTSGQKATAVEGADYIRALQKRYGHAITIMPGAGVSAENLPWLAAYTGCTQFHMSARTRVDGLNSVAEEVAYADYAKIKSARQALSHASEGL